MFYQELSLVAVKTISVSIIYIPTYLYVYLNTYFKLGTSIKNL